VVEEGVVRNRSDAQAGVGIPIPGPAGAPDEREDEEDESEPYNDFNSKDNLPELHYYYAVNREAFFKLLRPGVLAVFAIMAFALVRDTYFNGHDFKVYWETGGDLLQGRDPYSLALHPFGMVIKYPPWILPICMPWSWLPLRAALLLWGILEVVSLAACAFWIRRKGHAGWPAITVTILAFWGLWAVHAIDGQIVLPFLALILWLWPGEHEFSPGWRSSALLWALSWKAFTALPIFSFKLERRWLFSILLSLPVFFMLSVPALVSGVAGGPLQLLIHWAQAAGSGGTAMSSDLIRGVHNPSFTGALLYFAGVPPADVRADVAVSLWMAVLFGGTWAWASSRLGAVERWVGWLSCVPVIHPLPWWHLFVLAFPLAAIALDRSLIQTRASGRVLAGLGIFLIGAGTHRFMGIFGVESFGWFLEKAAGKSFGVMLCWASLLVTAPRIAAAPQQGGRPVRHTKSRS
jgi:hypothetical protein